MSLQLGEDERYQRRFGFWRPYVTDVIRRYLASGSWSLQSLSLGEIAKIYISALHALNVKIVVMSICWHFLQKKAFLSVPGPDLATPSTSRGLFLSNKFKF
jgi:hypothetical protein